MQVEVIRRLEQLASLCDAWEQAVENSNFNSIFVSHAWFYCWAKNFASNRNIYVVIAREGDKLLGILPLLLERHGRGIFSRVTLRSMSNLQTYKFNFIVNNDRSSEILTAMFRQLDRELPWHTIELNFVPGQAQNISLLQAMQGHEIFRMRSVFHMESPYTQIAGSWDDYLHERNKKIRKNWDYFERKLDKAGKTAIVSYHGGNDLAQRIDQALTIEQSSWKGDNKTAIANSREETAFYHELGQAMHERGEFSLHFLTLNDQPIAFDYCLTHNDRFNVLKTGYDPAYAKHSPGRVLRKKLLRQLHHDGQYQFYDLLGARDDWKMEWCDTTETLLHIHLYARRPVAILNYGMIQSIDWCKARLSRYPRTYHAVKAVYLWFSAFFVG